MRAIITPSLGRLTDSAGPFVATDWLISLLARLQALESPGVYVVPAPKQTTEEGDFRFLGGQAGQQWRPGLQWYFLHREKRCLFLPQFADLREQLRPTGVQLRQVLFGFGQQSVDLIQASHRDLYCSRRQTPPRDMQIVCCKLGWQCCQDREEEAGRFRYNQAIMELGPQCRMLSSYGDGPLAAGRGVMRMRPSSTTAKCPAQSVRLSSAATATRATCAEDGVEMRNKMMPLETGSLARKANSPKSLSKVTRIRSSARAHSRIC